MTLNEFRRHPAYDYCPLTRYLCLGIDCRAVILKQVKYEKK